MSTWLQAEFSEPGWLWALWILPLAAVALWMGHQRGRRLLDRLVASRLRASLAGAVSTPRRIFRAVLLLVTLGAVIVGLARPRTGWKEFDIKSSGRDVIIAVDVSRSMLATDVPPTRLERARLFIRDLLGFLPGDRVGVVAFAGSAFLQAPLTLDHSAILATVDELNPDLIPKGGTNLGEAIRTALLAFGTAEGSSRAIVVLSDGEELDADGIAAAREARDAGVTIFTVGIGSTEGSLIPITDERGRSDFVRDTQGQPVMSRLDADRLEEIANVTNGFYLGLEADTARELFMAGIEPMERTAGDGVATRQPIEAYQVPAVVAILCLMLWLLINERKWTGRRRAASSVLGVILAALFCREKPVG